MHLELEREIEPWRAVATLVIGLSGVAILLTANNIGAETSSWSFLLVPYALLASLAILWRGDESMIFMGVIMATLAVVVESAGEAFGLWQTHSWLKIGGAPIEYLQAGFYTPPIVLSILPRTDQWRWGFVGGYAVVTTISEALLIQNGLLVFTNWSLLNAFLFNILVGIIIVFGYLMLKESTQEERGILTATLAIFAILMLNLHGVLVG